MTEYRGHEIVVGAAYFSDGRTINPIFSIRKRRGQVVCKGVAYGSFDTQDDAEKAASTAACRWIDRQWASGSGMMGASNGAARRDAGNVLAMADQASPTISTKRPFFLRWLAWPGAI